MQINHIGETKCCIVNKFPTTVDQHLQMMIEKEGYIKFHVDKEGVTSKNNSLFSLTYAVNIKGITEEGDKETSLFVKCIKPFKGLPSMISITNVYKNELFVYKELLKIFEEIQEEANVPLAIRYKTVKFYEESTSQVIMLENMARKGFEASDRMEIISLQFAKISVQELAKFHGLSFVLKEKRPEYFETKIKSMKNHIQFDERWRSHVQNARKLTIPFVAEEYKKRVEKEYDILMNKYPTYFYNETTTACLCHGDFKSDNILVKMENNEIKDIVTLDYQHAQYACPIYDFLYFIYFNTDRDFRKAYMAELKQTYYKTLSTFIKNFNIDPESVYPQKEFEIEYQEKQDFGLAVSLLFLMFVFVPDECVTKVQELSFKADGRFKGRINGVIEDYIEWGYL